MDHPETVNHLSLCSGYGGLDLGLSRVIRGLRTIAYAEIEEFATALLAARMEGGQLDVAPIWSNLKTFPWASFHGLVDILSGGFPCQPFSAAGKRGGDEDPRHLFPHILRGITECRPGIVFLENVEGIISAKLAGTDWRDPAGTPVLLHVLRELERVGYQATAGVFSSREIGATHQRKRVFILGMADAVHDGCDGSEGPSRTGPSENQGWLRESEGVGSPQRNVYLRPKPPGPDQWWWEPARVVANAKGGLSGKPSQPERGQDIGSGSEGVGHPQQSRLEGSTGEGSNGTRGAWSQFPSGREPLADSVNQGVRGWTSQRRGDERQRPDGQATLPSGGGVDRSTVLLSSESSLGGNPDGSPNRLDYTQLCSTVDSRTDELRLLGNGVDPDVAARAFTVLYNRLTNTSPSL